MQSSAIDLRPTKWDEVIGQDNIVSAIQTKLKSGVPPAWLFVGPSGSGKTTIAEILSREIQGEIAEENIEFLNIERCNGADKNGIDDARKHIEDSRTYSRFGKYRVIIIDEAHKMTDPAQNALLIPTEPLKDEQTTTVWIFCTTEPNKLLPTLRSRCVTFELKPFGREEIRKLILLAANHTDATFLGTKSNAFVEEAYTKGLTNNREILYAWDKYVAGVPLEEAISPPPESNPVYTEIAKYAAKGNWAKTRILLQSVKSADAKGLKTVLSWFFRTELLNTTQNGSFGAFADSLSESLIRLGNLNSFEDGVTYSAIVGILYHHARKVSK